MSDHISRNVLVAPLDWGLGHATRCIPIIKALQKRSISVIIAASGPQKILLKTEFPGLEFLELPGYRIRFANDGKKLVWDLMRQIPRLLKAVREENKWLKKICRERSIDGIISDNRYGFCHRRVLSIFITHQLFIESGLGSRANKVLQRMNRLFINRFSMCWVPDFQNADSLAGKLSHPPRLPAIPVIYGGLLSRFKAGEKKLTAVPLLILISGPEPQRTVLEKIIFRELERYSGIAVVVRGLPGNVEKISLANRDIDVYNHLATDSLNELMDNAEFVICRSGYSTLMELARLQKRAILIPTPGQPEQEYLGTYLHEKKWAYTVAQETFNLKKCLTEMHEASFGFPDFPERPSADVLVAGLLESALFGGFR